MTNWALAPDDAYDAAESHGQHVPGSLDWYPGWYPESFVQRVDAVMAASAGVLAAVDSVLELLPVLEELTSGSSPAQGREAA